VAQGVLGDVFEPRALNCAREAFPDGTYLLSAMLNHIIAQRSLTSNFERGSSHGVHGHYGAPLAAFCLVVQAQVDLFSREVYPVPGQVEYGADAASGCELQDYCEANVRRVRGVHDPCGD